MQTNEKAGPARPALRSYHPAALSKLYSGANHNNSRIDAATVKGRSFARAARKLPPFGKRFIQMSPALTARRQHGGSIFLFCGPAAWERVAEHGEDFPILLLPPDTSPAAYHWPVQGWSVVVWDTGAPDSIVSALAILLHQAGAGFAWRYREAL